MFRKFRVNIPTKTYLKKYLQILFAGNFYLHRSDHHIKRFLFFLLEREQVVKYDMDNVKFACNDILTFSVGPDTLSRYGWNLPKDKVIEFNDYLEDHFREALHNFVRFRMAFGIKKKTAIEEFADIYGITPDDVDYDSLRRMEDRFRTKYQMDKIFFVRKDDDIKLNIPISKTPYPFRICIVTKIDPMEQSTLF
jgi:hypothetical protein